MKKPRLAAALALPLAALIAMAAIKQTKAIIGKKVLLPISGYDPRDLLAGHYLNFRVDYGTELPCESQNEFEGFVCLDPKHFSRSRPSRSECDHYIRGTCAGWRFVAGIERFYIPEAEGPRLEKLIRDKKAEIYVSVTPSGEATILDLMIDGQSWKRSQ